MPESMTRAQHLKWCKERALEYVDRGELAEAVGSMTSDLTKHPDAGPSDPQTMAFLMMVGMRDAVSGNAAAVRHWIEGF